MKGIPIPGTGRRKRHTRDNCKACRRRGRKVSLVVDELSQWDDEFDSPKWAVSTRRRMAEAIIERLDL